MQRQALAWTAYTAQHPNFTLKPEKIPHVLKSAAYVLQSFPSMQTPGPSVAGSVAGDAKAPNSISGDSRGRIMRLKDRFAAQMAARRAAMTQPAGADAKDSASADPTPAKVSRSPKYWCCERLTPSESSHEVAFCSSDLDQATLADQRCTGLGLLSGVYS